jgi:hypothetical protein
VDWMDKIAPEDCAKVARVTEFLVPEDLRERVLELCLEIDELKPTDLNLGARARGVLEVMDIATNALVASLAAHDIDLATFETTADVLEEWSNYPALEARLHRIVNRILEATGDEASIVMNEEKIERLLTGRMGPNGKADDCK